MPAPAGWAPAEWEWAHAYSAQEARKQNRVTGSLTISFARDPVLPRLTLEADPGFHWGYATMRLRLYPAVPAELRATYGTVVWTEIEREESVREVLTFAGDKTVQTKRPHPTGLVYRSYGLSFDVNGDVVRPTFHYDQDRDEVVASHAFYGAVEARYQARYRVLEYTAEVTAPHQAGVTMTTGTVLAYYQKAVATYQPDLSFADDPEQMEAYRVTSSVVVDERGVWEPPPNWPGSGQYGTGYTSYYVDPYCSITEERAHEIATLTIGGKLTKQRLNVPYLPPYQQDTPQFRQHTLQFRAPPNGDWFTAFSRLDRESIINDVQARYGRYVPVEVSG